MKIGSLFSGYGGLDMAVANVTGAETAWVSDIDKGACKILAHRYGDVPNLGDITDIDWTTVEPVDIITGGFPCQDLSHAGKRAGLKEGTRSGLWSHMARAIDELRPRLVVAENVRGLLSADAPGDVEPCSWCVGETPTVNLRALGVVLADLADLGYDAQWCGLRAADVGACHGRFRVFLIAHPAGNPWWLGDRDDVRDGSGAVGREPAAGRGSDAAQHSHTPVDLLPTPTSANAADGADLEHWEDARAELATKGYNGNGRGTPLAVAARLLPTPVTEPDTGNGHARNLGKEARLLPTPNPFHAGNEEDPEEWRERRADVFARTGTRHGPALGVIAKSIEAGDPLTPDRYMPDTLLPTPTSRDHKGRNQRDDDSCLTGALLPTPTATDAKASGGGYNGQNNVTLTDATARNGMLLPTPLVGSTSPASHGQISGQFRDQMDAALARFGDYAPAIARWESIIGRPAPDPTEPTGKGGAHRLSPKFVEWMMGLPEGWVTDVSNLTRNEALKALGNGVVPQQAEAALRHMLAMEAAA